MMMEFLIWILSFCVFIFLLYICYKVSYKLGIKKALYRTSYILLCVVFAFVLAPLVNDELFNFDLTRIGVSLNYKNNTFTTLIEYIEEVIAHSDFLNDLYSYFPSLKDLFMDFPQILLIPLTYVMLFFVFLIVFFPLYLYLSYKRKRRVLYERKDKRSHRVWAGVLGCIQCVFIVSVILSPLNGISRIYENATNYTLDEEYGSLCDEHEMLKRYGRYCDIIEAYSSTIFADIGGNKSLSNYVFDSLTRISYEDGYTSMSNEATLIVKGGIVLNQSGLLNSIDASSDSIPLDVIIENDLTDEDIDVIVETLSNSRYSESALLELERLLPNTLNDLMRLILNTNDFNIQYSINKEDLISEIKIVLKCLTMIKNSTFINDLIELREKFIYYVDEFPENRKNDVTTMAFLLEITDTIDISKVETFGEYLFESEIVSDMLPYVIDRYLKKFGVNFVSSSDDVLDQFYNAIDIFKLIEKYRPHDFFDLIASLDDEELMLFAEIVDYVVNSPSSRGLVKYLLTLIFRDIGDYLPSELIDIRNWSKEIYVVKDICVLIKKINSGNSIEMYEVREILANKDSEIVKAAFTVFKKNPDFFFRELLIGLAK